ncbi:MAG: ribokinase [Verrucomicrobia bacterium]|jgi:ribokinase|nr:ribokinase [Verrucomicrobiota bacterium]
MKTKITVIGSANIDFIMRAPHLPALGETVTDCSFLQTFGGKGANQAVAAARAGGAVTFVGALGNDPYEPIMRRNFLDDGIDVEHLAKCDDLSSGTALVMFDGEGNNYLTVAPGSNYRVTPDSVRAAEEAIAATDWIILQQEIPLEANQAALELAAKYDRPVLFNFAPAHELRLKPGPAIHGLVVNEIEAAAVAGLDTSPRDVPEAATAARKLLDRGGHRFVIVTLGSKGSVALTRSGESFHVPAAPCKAVDSTAAGDTFCGALAVALAENKPLEEAARFAAAAAALAVAKAGAQPSIPRRPRIESALLR